MIPSKNSNMAIFFADDDYLQNFMNYITERNTGFICFGFTREENIKEFAEKNRIAILLTDDICFSTTARNINSEITIVLSEKPTEETMADVYEINILQPVDEIVREILQIATKNDISVEQNTHFTSSKLYSFFSPIGRSLKTTLAVASSQLLSDKEKTLYLNLEPDSGFTVLFDQDFGTDLSDLMFYLRDGTGEKTSLMLQSTLCNSHGFSFIPPVINPGDLFQISGDDILRLLALLQGNGFRYIVIDMGTHLPGFEKILSASDRIYMPSRGDTMSSAKIAQFFSYLRTLEDMQIEEKTVRLEPPYFKDIPTAADNLRGTETGNYMAGILYEK